MAVAVAVAVAVVVSVVAVSGLAQAQRTIAGRMAPVGPGIGLEVGARMGAGVAWVAVGLVAAPVVVVVGLHKDWGNPSFVHKTSLEVHS